MSYLISSLLAFFARIYKEINDKLLFVKKHINLKNSFVSVVFVCFFNLGNAWGQINYSFNFDANATGWTGNFTRFTGNTACGGSGGSMYRNLYSSVTTGQLISPSVGTSNGMAATVSYSYKAAVWSANNVAQANWGTFDVQYGSTATGPWTTFATVTNETQLGNPCISKSHNVTLPVGNIFIRFRPTWQSGDYYLNFDNIVVTQAAAPPCSGTPNSGTASISSSSGCSGVNFNLSASGLSIGTGITYQWQSSPTGAAPWTDIAGANASTLTTSTTNTMYYQLVTICSNSGQSATTNVVPYNVTGTGCAGACPTNIPSVPVTNQSLVCNSTAVPGALNATNVTSICGGATTAYMGGQDAIYTFTPATSGSYTISYNGQTWSSIFVYSGACPASGGTCVGSVGTSNSSQSLTVTLTAGVQYFIWFDTYPTPNSPCPGTFSISAPTVCTGTSVTLNMTDTYSDGWDGAEFRLQEAGGTIYGPYTLTTGASGTQSICLPNGCYRVILTEGDFPDEIGWSLTNGATTYASATAPNAAPFNTLFTIGGAICPSAPVNDLCVNAAVIDLGLNLNQTYTGTGIGSTNTIGLTQYSETWINIIVPCSGMNLSLSYCSNTPIIDNAYTDLFSSCGANPTLTGITNFNFTSCPNGSVTLIWNNIQAGTYYYPILIDNIAWPGSYTLSIVGSYLSSPPTGSTTQTFCSSDNPTIASLIATGTDIKWYYASSGGNSLPSTLGLSNGATYYASQTIGGVESNCRLAVTVTINPVPVSPAITGSTNLCWNETTTLTPEYPTGGTITNSGGYRIHTFTTDGTLIVPAGFSGNAQVLVVAGGGGGGSGRGGGGGAGGLIYNSNFSLMAGTSYPVTVGAGGAAEANGSNSVFSILTAIGGGRGGSHNGNNTITTNNGQNGGSGGGAAINYYGNTFAGGNASVGQGNNGATSSTTLSDDPRNTGGGGGFAEAGRAGSGGNVTWSTGTSPKGGDGLYFPQFTAFGSAGWFAGGGGGSRGGSDRQGAPAGAGGQGGGGAGQSTATGTAGTPNTGGGGGGSEGTGGNGGSGIVIVRYYIGTPSWSSQNTAVATVSNGVVTGVAPGESTTIDYTVAAVGGCSSATVSTPINVIGGQQIAPTGAQCSGTQLNFDALPNPSVSGTSISWTVTTPAGLTATTTSGNTNLFSTTFTNTTLGNLTPTITVSQTIGALTCTRDFTPTIKFGPIANIVGTLNFCPNQNTTLIASGGGTYSWSPGGGTTDQITVSSADTYTVTVTLNGCQDTESVTVTQLNTSTITNITPP